MSTTLKNIAIEWLQDHGFDGLCNDSCACIISDLMPCEDWIGGNCESGYRVYFGENEECPCGEGCDWHIQTKKPT